MPALLHLVVENGKAKKVIVYKYKRKNWLSTRKTDIRQQFTKVKIEKINA